MAEEKKKSLMDSDKFSAVLAGIFLVAAVLNYLSGAHELSAAFFIFSAGMAGNWVRKLRVKNLRY